MVSEVIPTLLSCNVHILLKWFRRVAIAVQGEKGKGRKAKGVKAGESAEGRAEAGKPSGMNTPTNKWRPMLCHCCLAPVVLSMTPHLLCTCWAPVSYPQPHHLAQGWVSCL